MPPNIGESKTNMFIAYCEKGIPDRYIIVHALYINSLSEKFGADPETSE